MDSPPSIPAVAAAAAISAPVVFTEVVAADVAEVNPAVEGGFIEKDMFVSPRPVVVIVVAVEGSRLSEVVSFEAVRRLEEESCCLVVMSFSGLILLLLLVPELRAVSEVPLVAEAVVVCRLPVVAIDNERKLRSFLRAAANSSSAFFLSLFSCDEMCDELGTSAVVSSNILSNSGVNKPSKADHGSTGVQ